MLHLSVTLILRMKRNWKDPSWNYFYLFYIFLRNLKDPFWNWFDKNRNYSGVYFWRNSMVNVMNGLAHWLIDELVTIVLRCRSWYWRWFTDIISKNQFEKIENELIYRIWENIISMNMSWSAEPECEREHLHAHRHCSRPL